MNENKFKGPLVVNLFAQPGAGKSTGAAYIFSKLKMQGINAELITEVAKDFTWEGNNLALDCQEYVFGCQSYRMKRCKNDVDVIITDSPLPLGIVYNKNERLDRGWEHSVISIFESYKNINYFINRVKKYNPKGRNQTEAESDALGHKIKELLYDWNIPFEEISGDIDYYNKVVKDVLLELGIS